MKIKWLKQIFISNRKSWLDILSNDINLTYLSSLGSQYCLSVRYKLNPFWKAVFTYFNQFCLHIQANTNLDVLCTSIWLNKPLGTENIYFADWFRNGIHVIGDIIKQDGHILTLDEIKTRYMFNPNYLNYFTIRGLVKRFIEQNHVSHRSDFCQPYIYTNIY